MYNVRGLIRCARSIAVMPTTTNYGLAITHKPVTQLVDPSCVKKSKIVPSNNLQTQPQYYCAVHCHDALSIRLPNNPHHRYCHPVGPIFRLQYVVVIATMVLCLSYLVHNKYKINTSISYLYVWITARAKEIRPSLKHMHASCMHTSYDSSYHPIPTPMLCSYKTNPPLL